MKHGIELNGVANLSILINELEDYYSEKYGSENARKMVKDFKDQTNFLERYMIAYNDAINSNNEPPKWHDITSNPNRYPTNGERFK